jgi:uncharacterized UPF0160 family protein
VDPLLPSTYCRTFLQVSYSDPLFFATIVCTRSMPAAWRGVRDQALSDVSGIPGCVFVHAGGFIGGNATYDGALAMAKKSLVLD